MKAPTWIWLILLSILTLACTPKQKIGTREYAYKPDTTVVFKRVDTVSLSMEVFFPPKDSRNRLKPALVFFFGGGWVSGTVSQFAPQAGYYAQKGYVTFLADYRVQSRNRTTPFESLMDAKSAIRYIRGNAAVFGVDPARIIACGGSAGGHLAAATALISGYNDPADDTLISSRPEALVLFNPVIDNGPGGYGYERIGDRYPGFSPLHNIRRNAPPTLILIGTEDQLVPLKTVYAYQKKMDSVGSYCEVKTFKGQQHGFFNYWFPDNYKKTLRDVDAFLGKLRK